VSIESSPNAGSSSNQLRAVAGVHILYAVGDIGAALNNKTLAMVCTTC
jgi:hypothetical protein